jgi:hypothetical protein
MSDVFWPKESARNIIEVDKYITAIEQKTGYPVQLRDNVLNSVGKNNMFSSPESRDKIEQEFLLAGIKIVNGCNTKFPPLGISAFAGLGFGGTLMSYRNIPNNTPLCWWWGDPRNNMGLGNWYPLMMRRVYD